MAVNEWVKSIRYVNDAKTMERFQWKLDDRRDE